MKNLQEDLAKLILNPSPMANREFIQRLADVIESNVVGEDMRQLLRALDVDLYDEDGNEFKK